MAIPTNSKKLPVIYNSERHPFHIVDPSPWPFLVAMSLFQLLVKTVFFLHGLPYGYQHGLLITHVMSFIFIYSIINWFYDIVIEGLIEGHHTLRVQRGLRMGIVLFIISEVMFFFSFFWAFFHFSLSPSIAIGCVWPPLGIKVLNPWGLPFLNTVILLSSGVSVTWAHRAIAHRVVYKAEYNWIAKTLIEIKCRLAGTNYLVINYYRRSALTALLITIFWGVLFTLIQKYEYEHATFTIADSVYGSIFYLITGFHGLHVIIGTVFLIVCFFRHLFYHFSRTHHVGLEAAIWYWHFVDIVWLCVFVCVYWWGGV